jgi:hypothetical protein
MTAEHWDEEREVDEKKKTSLRAKLGGMLHSARRDGQTPKRWIWSSEFYVKILNDVAADMAYVQLSHLDRYLGLPFTVSQSTLHECVLEVE